MAVDTIDFTLYGYRFRSRYCGTFAVDRRWSVCQIQFLPSVPVPSGSDDAVAALLYRVGAGAGHCIASLLTVPGCLRLRYRSILYVWGRSPYRHGFFVMMTVTDSFLFALRRCSAGLMGCQRRHPSLFLSLATVPCCVER